MLVLPNPTEGTPPPIACQGDSLTPERVKVTGEHPRHRRLIERINPPASADGEGNINGRYQASALTC